MLRLVETQIFVDNIEGFEEALELLTPITFIELGGICTVEDYEEDCAMNVTVFDEDGFTVGWIFVNNHKVKTVTPRMFELNFESEEL